MCLLLFTVFLRAARFLPVHSYPQVSLAPSPDRVPLPAPLLSPVPAPPSSTAGSETAAWASAEKAEMRLGSPGASVAEHVFLVTVDTLAGLPASPKRAGLYIMYMFPGQGEPLYTQVYALRPRAIGSHAPGICCPPSRDWLPRVGIFSPPSRD